METSAVLYLIRAIQEEKIDCETAIKYTNAGLTRQQMEVIIGGKTLGLEPMVPKPKSGYREIINEQGIYDRGVGVDEYLSK